MVCLLVIITMINEFFCVFPSLENFHRIDPSGRLPYNVLPGILQRYGILLTENDLVSAAKDLEYNCKILFYFLQPTLNYSSFS